MTVQQIHHVTVIVNNLDEACSFYEEVLGLEPLPTINLDFPAQFFKVGERQQLHVTEWDDAGGHSFRGHVCFQVDEFMPLFTKAKALSILDTGPWGKTRMLPDGAMQMFLRDPSGNLLEISCKPGTFVEASVFADAQVEPEKSIYRSGRNDLRGKRRAAEGDMTSINSSDD